PPSPRRRMVSYRPRKTRPIMRRPTSLFTSGGTMRTVARGGRKCTPPGRFALAESFAPARTPGRSQHADAPPLDAQAALGEQADRLGIGLALLLKDAGGEGIRRVAVED